MLTVDVFKDPSDFVALGASVLAAVATAWAVWVAVLDSRQANKRAARAEEETEDLRRRLAAERDSADAVAWADKGAIYVNASGELQQDTVTADLYGQVRVVVENNDSHPIKNVIVLAEDPHGSIGRTTGNGYGVIARWNWIGAMSDEQSLPMVPVGPDDDNNEKQPVRITTLFDDHLGNRWRLNHDRSLLLFRRRHLGVDDDPLDDFGL